MEIKNLVVKYKKIMIAVLVILLVGGGWLYKNSQQVNNQDVFKDVEIKKPNANKKIANKNNNEKSLEDTKKITVDLTGAVVKEGVYQLAADSRVNDLVNHAGGLVPNADLKQINRAQKLQDQDKIYIPFKGEIIQSSTDSSASSSTIKPNNTTDSNPNHTNTEEKINLNTANESDLMKLNGIGAKKAEQIITYRDENGPFKSPKDITKVSGIGDKTFENLQDQITI